MNNSQDLVKIYKISFTCLRQLYLDSLTLPIYILSFIVNSRDSFYCLYTCSGDISSSSKLCLIDS
jgi:hypothetical protein